MYVTLEYSQDLDGLNEGVLSFLGLNPEEVLEVGLCVEYEVEEYKYYDNSEQTDITICKVEALGKNITELLSKKEMKSIEETIEEQIEKDR